MVLYDRNPATYTFPMLANEEVQATIKNKEHNLKQKDYNLRGTDSCINQSVLWWEQRKAGYIKSKSTKYNSLKQMKDSD